MGNDGGEDVFIHVKDLVDAEGLSQGDDVLFDTEWDDRKGKYKGSNCSLKNGSGGGNGGGCYGGRSYGGGGYGSYKGGKGGKGDKGKDKGDDRYSPYGNGGW